MIVLDTSALIRFFTNDISSKALLVKNLIESNQKLTIPDVVFPELEYVLLGNTYNASRENIYKAFRYLITRKNIVVSKDVMSAVEVYKKTKLDIADCIIATTSFKNELFSFDKGLLSVKGVKQVKLTEL